MNPNGQTDGESRLDRMERLFEQYAERNEKEHKLLLTAQVLMVDTMTKLETRVIEIGYKLDGLIGVVGDLGVD